MTLTVSVSEFRNNISEYLDKVAAGTRVFIRDAKKDKTIAEVASSKSFDPVAFEKALDKTAGVFTAENHPEWRTKKDVNRWLRETRKNFDRKF